MTVPAPAPLASGGGGGGGLTAESDEVILVDSGNANTPFIRRFEKDAAGLVTDFDDYQLNGTTAYVFTGPAVPFSSIYTDAAPLVVRPSNAGPTTSIACSRYLVGASPVTIAANALRVHVITVADTVTVEGANVPAGVGLTFGVDGFRTEELNLTISGAGDVLVIEERAV